MSNKKLKDKVLKHLKIMGWKNITPESAPIELWNHGENQIVLPVDSLIQHSQSIALLEAAISSIFEIDKVNLNLEFEVDRVSVQASGQNIGYGRIIYQEGLKALSGLYEIIKNNASSNINIKGKTKYVNEYMSEVHMMAPDSGSMIYKAELGLYEPQEDNDNESFQDLGSLGRVLNSRCAKLVLKAAKTFESSREFSPAELMHVGIDIKFCEAFVNLFSASSETLRFQFDWSPKEIVSDDVPTEVLFNIAHKEAAQKYVKAFKKTESLSLVEQPAIIEKYSWPQDATKGKVSFKTSLDNIDYSMTYETDEILYLRLKQEKVKKEVALSGKFLRTKNKKSKLEILSLVSIKIGPQDTLDIDEPDIDN